ncbi:NUDIX domain-containing protein [Candidatus Peregrinibacteria bacterium]|nr:NUDIX domain-containing protein [Candidatus Peregrinibacteria bacterium]
MWKKMSSKEIFSHSRLTLIEDEVELPNGIKTTYLKFKDDGSSAGTIICKRDDGKILVQKEYSYPPNQKLFQFPGGTISADEDLKEGINRELMEEADLKANNLELIGEYLVDNRRSTAKFYIFLATELEESSLPADEEEDIESFWFSEQEIDEMIAKGQIINCHLIAAWTFYKLKK